MDKGGENINKKIIIAIVAVVILAILGVLFLIGSADVQLFAGEDVITLPSDYLIDDNGIAYSPDGDIGVYFVSVIGANMSAQDELFDALEARGSDSGYKNVSVETINGYKAYLYGANPDKLKDVSSDKVISGNYETWKDYHPYTPFKDVSNMDVAKFRYVAFVNKTTEKIDELYIFTNNTDVDLYSSDIEAIINSIAHVEAE